MQVLVTNFFSLIMDIFFMFYLSMTISIKSVVSEKISKRAKELDINLSAKHIPLSKNTKISK